jgi:Nuclease-related domain
MQNLNPTRIVARRGRDAMIVGALLLMVGLITGGCGLIALLLFSSTTVGLIFFGIGFVILLVGAGFMIRGLSYRKENYPALAVADVLARELDSRFTFIRNVSRRGLGYIDAVLVGPPGTLVFRIVDKGGIFLNEGADWLERRGGQTFELSRMNPTRECVTDIFALREYLGRRGLSAVPVFGVIVFTNPQVQLSARQPVVPIAELRTLTTVLRRDYLLEDRIDPKTVETTVQVIYT